MVFSDATDNHLRLWSASAQHLLPEIISRIPILAAVPNPFDCAASRTVLYRQGNWTTAMIETVTAIFGLLSASIFLAHAFEGYRSRPRTQAVRAASTRRFRNL
jgi:hypothetical protein